MKANLIEMLKAQGFSEVESKSETIQQCNGVILQRDWSRKVEVAFHGSYLESIGAENFLHSGIWAESPLKFCVGINNKKRR